MDAITVVVIIIIAIIAVIKVIKMIVTDQADRNQEPLPLSDPRSSRQTNRNTNIGVSGMLNPNPSEIETGEMVYLANSSWPGDREYHFNYKKQANSWRAYILKTPDLAGRSQNGGTIHTLGGPDSRYICWDRPVETLEGMQAISRRWADNMQKYIHTGRFG